MFLDIKKKEGYRCLRNEFLDSLFVELKKEEFKREEAKLRNRLKKQLEEGII